MKSAIVDNGTCWLQILFSMVDDVLREREWVKECHESLNRQISCVSRKLSEAEVGNDRCGAFLAPAPQTAATSDDDYIVVRHS